MLIGRVTPIPIPETSHDRVLMVIDSPEHAELFKKFLKPWEAAKTETERGTRDIAGAREGGGVTVQ